MRPEPASSRRRRAGLVLGRLALYGILVAGAIGMLVPFAWMVTSSLKGRHEVFVFPPRWIPSPPRWSNYAEAMTIQPFGRYFYNTVILELLVILGTLVSNAIPAYSFARLRWRGRDLVFYLLLSILMLPYFVTLVPTFILWSFLGGVNTYWPLALPAWFGNPFFIFLLRQFYLTIPLDLEDAALIDGASYGTIFARIILPLTKPALAVVAIFTFMGVWNDFLAPLIYLNDPRKWTVALGLAQFIGIYSQRWDLLMAASTVVVLPMILVFLFFQRYFVEGITLTGIKG
ncbi:MAG: carbohydrate ABC transporter permease [Bacillota bacterium]